MAVVTCLTCACVHSLEDGFGYVPIVWMTVWLVDEVASQQRSVSLSGIRKSWHTGLYIVLLAVVAKV